MHSTRGSLGARSACAALVFAAALAAIAGAATTDEIAAGTRLRFHLTAPLSSSDSKTGQTFGFVLLDPIQQNGHVVVAEGAMGSGTVYLAGHAGTSGHEGDLTLRLDSVPTADGRVASFADQRFEINGRNRKIQAGVLGFVPFAGFGARFIRGSEVRIDASTPVETVLLRDATIANEALPVPSPSPAPIPSASPSASPAPSPSPSAAPT